MGIGYLFLHWLADFICQTSNMALNKSKSLYWLGLHSIVYAIVMSLGAINLGMKAEIASWFLLMMFMTHFAIDGVTSVVNAKLWEDKKVRWFFISIGFDQFLHYSAIVLFFRSFPM